MSERVSERDRAVLAIVCKQCAHVDLLTLSFYNNFRTSAHTMMPMNMHIEWKVDAFQLLLLLFYTR